MRNDDIDRRIQRVRSRYGTPIESDPTTWNARTDPDVLRICDELEQLRAVVARLQPPPGKCEHGVADGDWCEPCNREYKEAAEAAKESDT